MIRKTFALIISFISISLASMTTNAVVPKVVVDIAPVHSLVSQVMDGVGEPALIIPAEASPHSYTLRPSQAQALSDADLVLWMGEELTPWLAKAIDNVADAAQKLEMLKLEGTVTHAYREGVTFETHKHDDEHDENLEHEDSHNHDQHEGVDPHAWLDPANAKVWIHVIAKKLGELDSENAAIYVKNANVAASDLDKLIKVTQVTIDALGHPKFIVFHDAYQYFEKRFGISAAGSISLSDAQDPSPSRVKEIQGIVKKLGVTCVFTEPQYNANLVNNIFEGTSVSTIGVMDPLGSTHKVGKQHYSQLINSMVMSIRSCQ